MKLEDLPPAMRASLVGQEKPPRAKGRALEHWEQKTLFQWLDLMAVKHPVLSLAFAIPNGGARSKATAGKMRAEGQKSGVPDIFLPMVYYPEIGLPVRAGLFIELKVKPNYPSESQKAWQARLRAEGYCVECVRGEPGEVWKMAARVIAAYVGFECNV